MKFINLVTIIVLCTSMVLISLDSFSQKSNPDTVGYYSLYLKKRNNNGSEKWVDPGAKIKVMTIQQRGLSNWNRVKSISDSEIIFDNGEIVRVDNLSKVVKKNHPEISVLGAVITAIGIGTWVYVGTGTVSFDHIGELTLAGFAMTTIGIAIVTPPVFSKKKKSKIRVERLYRY